MRTGEGVLSHLDSVQQEVAQGNFSQWRRNSILYIEAYQKLYRSQELYMAVENSQSICAW